MLQPLPMILMLALTPAADPAALPRARLTPIGVIQHRPIAEASGLLRSRNHPSVFWTMNDSGHPPQLFAIDRGGKLLGEYRVKGALNFDWEAIAGDGNGHLYIGDIGNNIVPGGAAPRWVYRVKEPAPGTGRVSAEIAVEQTYFYTFPGKRFDSEAMFFHGQSLFLVSKASQGSAGLYRLPLDKPGRNVRLDKVCDLADVLYVTDAALSADGRRLALCSYRYVALFTLNSGERLEDMRNKQPAIIRFGGTEIEGCSWDGDTLILVGEDRKLHALRF